MVSAIGSSPSSASIGSGASSGMLEFQLAQCERQLSDWVHCSSAKTPEGKAMIQALSDKVGEIQTRIKKADEARPVNQSTMVNTKTPAAIGTSKDGATVPGLDETTASSNSTTRSMGTAVGGLIDVFV